MAKRVVAWRSMRRPGMVGLGVALCGGLALADADRDEVFPDKGFSDRSVTGTWSYAGNPGLLVPPAAPEPSPAATIGQFHFDGHGGCFAHGFVNVLGSTVETETLECTYSVSPSGWSARPRPSHEQRAVHGAIRPRQV